MDPYLESRWNDVHGSLIAYIRDDLNAHLPDDYRAALEERVVLEKYDDNLVQSRYPDVSVFGSPNWKPAAEQDVDAEDGDVAVLVQYASEPITQYSVRIVDTRHGDRLVTAIEVLSPENKRPGDAARQYREKTRELRAAGAGLVQIDLLRQGDRQFGFDESVVREHKLLAPYYVTVYPPGANGKCLLYMVQLRKRLPTIKVPLKPEDGYVKLELQPLIDRVYANGRFRIDYAKPPETPLSDDDAAWLRDRLKSA